MMTSDRERTPASVTFYVLEQEDSYIFSAK